MKILIATPLLPSQPGGPGMYAVQLAIALRERGSTVNVIAFGDVMQYVPIIRHLVYLIRVWRAMRGVDVVLVLDTWSVALPTRIASFLRQKKMIIRIGGDYLWEHFVGRTHTKILLSEFYAKRPNINFKERVVLALQKRFILPGAHTIIFSTPWQRDLWRLPYQLTARRVSVIENAYAYTDEKKDGNTSTHDGSQRVVWVGRPHPLKNVEALDFAVEDVRKTVPALVYEKYTHISHDEVKKKLRGARVLVIPSVSEVSPNLALEALSLGIPVILTTDCGLHHVLDGVVAWVDSRDPVSIASAIRAHMDTTTYAEIRSRVQEFQPTRSYLDVADDFLTLFNDMV